MRTRIILVACILLASVFSLEAVVTKLGTPVIVRPIDGEAIIFETSRIDSITFSNLSVDSVECSTPVTQLIWTADSVYAFPLEEIAQVDFHKKNEAKAGIKVVEINDDLIKYFTGTTNIYNERDGRFYDTFSIGLSSSIPSEMIPEAGDVWIYDGINENFPNGFIGRCTGLQNSHFTGELRGANFERIDISEAYSNYYSSYLYIPERNLLDNEIVKYTDEGIAERKPLSASPIQQTKNGDYWLPWVTLPLSFYLNDQPWESIPLEIGLGADLDISTRLGIKYLITRIVENERSTLSVEVYGTQQFHLAGGVSLDGAFSKNIPVTPSLRQPIAAAPGLVVETYASLDLALMGKIGVDMTGSDFTSNFGFKASYSTGKGGKNFTVKPSCRFIPKWGGITPVGQGSLSVGFSLNWRLAALSKQIVSIGPSAKMALEFGVNTTTLADAWEHSDRSVELYTSLSEDDAFTVDLTRSIEGSVNIGNVTAGASAEFDRHNIVSKPIMAHVEDFYAQRQDYSNIRAISSTRNYPAFGSPVISAEVDRGFLAYGIGEDNAMDVDTQSQAWVSDNSVEINENTYTGLLTKTGNDKTYRVFPATRPFSGLGSDKIVACSPFLDVKFEEPVESDGKFKYTYAAYPKDENDYRLKGIHYVFETDFPEFDFRDYIDENTLEWGWFCVESNVSSWQPAPQLEGREPYGLHPLKEKFVSGANRDCTVFWNVYGNQDNLYSAEVCIGFYRKQAGDWREEYDVLWFKNCIFQHKIDINHFWEFSDFEASYEKIGNDYRIDYSFDYIPTAPEFTPGSIERPQWFGVDSNHILTMGLYLPIGYLDCNFENGESFQYWYSYSADPGECGFFYHDNFNSNEWWNAYRLKDKMRLHGSMTCKEGNNVRVVIGEDFGSLRHNMEGNHVFLLLEQKYNSITSKYHLKSFKCRTRPYSGPFKYLPNPDPRYYYDTYQYLF